MKIYRFLILALLVTSCGKQEIDPDLIIPDRAQTDLRKPQWVPDDENYPLYPEVKERGPETGSLPAPVDTSAKTFPPLVDSILNNPESAAAIEEALTQAMESAPAILEGIQKIAAESQGENRSIESFAPEMLEAILNGNADIPPETVDQISGVISEYAPLVLEGILEQKPEGERSLSGSVAGFILKKILESDRPPPPVKPGGY